jgi:hypothetical protein
MGPRSEQETKQPPSLEASKFGFGPDTPPEFKFDPTDADIVAYYLLPRALNLPNPYAHAIFEGDPASAPPWEILKRCGDVDHAFFFGPPTDASQNGGRKNRVVQGGVWQGQKATEETVTLLRPGGGVAAAAQIRLQVRELKRLLHNISAVVKSWLKH